MSIGICLFSGVKIRVNFIVKWAFRKAQRWFVSFLPYWILAALSVIKSGPKIERAGIADNMAFMSFDFFIAVDAAFFAIILSFNTL